MRKNIFEKPELIVILFTNDDVIRTSETGPGGSEPGDGPENSDWE